MPRYLVTGQITISVHTEVDADTPEQARDFAEARGVQSLCRQCAEGESDVEWVTTGELDGEPQGLVVEVMS